MRSRIFPYLVPLIAVGIAAVLIIGIGNILLFTADAFHTYGEFGKVMPALVGLILVILIGLVAALMSLRASKLPPAAIPEPRSHEPVRRIDLGAGYIAGQFVFFAGLALLLLFIVMSFKR